MVTIVAFNVKLINLNKQLDQRTREIRNIGIELEKLNEQQKLDQTKAQQIELQKQIDDLRQRVEAKKALEAAQIAQTPTFPPAPVAQASGSCGEWMAQAGVTDMASASIIINRESGCNPNAVNKSSGAYGIPQALPASKIAHCGSNPVCQIQWMQDYVNRRYGGWAGAVAHSNSKGWY